MNNRFFRLAGHLFSIAPELSKCKGYQKKLLCSLKRTDGTPRELASERPAVIVLGERAHEGQ